MPSFIYSNDPMYRILAGSTCLIHHNRRLSIGIVTTGQFYASSRCRWRKLRRSHFRIEVSITRYDGLKCIFVFYKFHVESANCFSFDAEIDIGDSWSGTDKCEVFILLGSMKIFFKNRIDFVLKMIADSSFVFES